MANILEFLRGLLTSGDEQERFEANPHGYLTAHGFDDLSGEDVAEAMRALTRTLPGDVADRLAPFHSEDGDLPSVRPQIGESELDAAVRQLQFATSLSPAESAGSPPEPEPTSESVAEPETEPEPEREPELVAFQPEPVSEPVYAAQAGIDPYRAFGEELSSIIRHARDQMQEVLRRAEDQADAIVRQAEREAHAIRDAERELRTRLQGVETGFRSVEEDGVVPDDPEG